jgi:hypothetical protein
MIDASIPLSAVAVQPINPIENAQRLAQLKNTQLQNQQGQQTLAQLGQQTQEGAIKLRDDQIVGAAYVKNHGDLDKTIQDASTGGASPGRLQQLQLHNLEVQKQSLGIIQTKGAIALQQADLQTGAHARVDAAAPADRPAKYQQELQGLQQAGVDTSQMPPQYPGDQAFKFLGATAQGYSKSLENAVKQSQGTEAAGKGAEAQANANKINAESEWYKKMGLPPGVPPDTMAVGQFLQQNPNSTVAQALGNKAATVANAELPAKIAAARAETQARLDVQNSGAAADSGGQPSQVAQAIANGQMSWKDAVSMRTPMATKNAILDQVFKLNPSFDTAEFGLEKGVAQKARSGAWADTRLAYNTALDHSQQLLGALNALGNGDVKKLNSLKNYFSTQFGSPDVSNYQAIANAYNHEVTQVVSKGHITDSEVAQGAGVLPANASPQQIRGVVTTYNNLMKSKRDELDKIIRSGAGTKANSVINQDSGSTSPPQTGGALAGAQNKASKWGSPIQ